MIGYIQSNRLGKYSLWIGLIWLLVACVFVPVDTSSGFPYDLLLQNQELPEGWYRTGSSAPEVSGAMSRRVAFGGSQNPGEDYVLIKHQLTVYSSTQAAQDAYTEWDSQWFPTSDWQQPEESTFTPNNTQDQFRLACINVAINGLPVMTCGYLQQHGQLISLVLTNLDNQHLTLKQFEQILKGMDERLQSYNTLRHKYLSLELGKTAQGVR